MRRGVVVRTVINGLTFDGATKDPMQKAVRDALIAFMAAMAEAQAEATKEAQRAGIAHAMATEPRAYRGRKPSFDREALESYAAADPGRHPHRDLEGDGLSRQTVYRIKDDPANAEGLLVQVEPVDRPVGRYWSALSGKPARRGRTRPGLPPYEVASGYVIVSEHWLPRQRATRAAPPLALSSLRPAL